MNQILKQITMDEITAIINKVSKNHAAKTFGIHNDDDISQQASLICWEKIDEFNINKIKDSNIGQALENWLNKVVSNRLKNFYRDHYQNKRKSFRSDIDEQDLKKRESLLHSISIHDTVIFNGIYDPENAEAHETLRNILTNLSQEEIEVMEALLNGDKIGSYYKIKIMKKIGEIWKTNEEN